MRLTPERLRELLVEHGWRIEPSGRIPGNWLATSPFEHWQRATPDVLQKTRVIGGVTCHPVWSATYTELRQIGWMGHSENGRLAAYVREAGAPWVAVSTYKPSNTALVAYVAQYGKASCEAAMSEAAERDRHEPVAPTLNFGRQPARCACGWTSPELVEGQNAAATRWRQHVDSAMATYAAALEGTTTP